MTPSARSPLLLAAPVGLCLALPASAFRPVPKPATHTARQRCPLGSSALGITRFTGTAPIARKWPAASKATSVTA
jgi:hypothetical protein